MKQREIQELIQDFLDFIGNRGSKRTAETYKFALNSYFKKYKEINKENAIKFYSDLAVKSPATRSAYISAMSSFCDWLIEIGKLKYNPFRSKILKRDVPFRLPKPLTDEQLVLIEQHLPQWIVPYYRLMLGAGLRLSEACNPDNIQILRDEKGRVFLRVIGKGNKERVVPYIFGNLEGLPGKINPKKIKNFFYKLSKKLNFTVSAHRLRHTFATKALEKGIDLQGIARMLGHESMRTTMGYAALTGKKLKEYADILREEK